MYPTHSNVAMLVDIYDDLARVERYADEDMLLHTAQRGVGPVAATLRGKAAIVAKMHALIALSGNTLQMRVSHIVADDYFGAVLGHIAASRHGEDLNMPFCGVWRFRDGVILEHWENAYDCPRLDAFLAGTTFTPGQSRDA